MHGNPTSAAPALPAPRTRCDNSKVITLGVRARRAVIAGAVGALGLAAASATPAAGTARTGNLVVKPSLAAVAALPTPATPPPGRITVGDSLSVGASTLLLQHGYWVNGKVGRQFSAAPAILRSYGDALPANVVVELGTNGLIRRSDCRAVLRIAGPLRRVFFVNNHMPRSWQAKNNKMLRSCIRPAADRAWLVDWYQASDGAWDWFAADDVHLTGSGTLALVTLIDAAVATYGH